MKKLIFLILLLFSIKGFAAEKEVFVQRKIVFKIVPVAVTVDQNDNVYIADRFSMSILKYNKKWEYLFSFGIKNRKNESPDFTPIDVFAVENEIYVLDISGGIYVFDQNGKYLRGVNYKKGKLRGESSGARAIYVGDYIYMADTNNSRIQIIKKDGSPYREFGYKGEYNGQFIYPEGVVLRGENEIIVSDSSTNRVDVFGRNGFFNRTIEDSKRKFLRPIGLFADEKEYLYVIDSGNKQLKVFDKYDRLLYFIDLRGANKRARMEINDIWVKGEFIYISDTLNKKVTVYDKNMKYRGEIGKSKEVIILVKTIFVILIIFIMLWLLKKEQKARREEEWRIEL